jgi:hypothetical protein
MIVKTLKINDVLVGMAVPKQYNGNVGYFVEDVLAKYGYAINRFRGCDMIIANTGVEVKTRNVDSNASHTVCTSTYEEICNTSYEESNLKSKFQQQYRVYFKDGDPGVIVKAKVCQFTDEWIQDQIKESYETARKILADDSEYANSAPWTTIRGFTNCPGYFEKTKNGTSWTFRVTDWAMKQFESIDANRTYVNDLFN